jgi:nucleoid DNA-binding protein
MNEKLNIQNLSDEFAESYGINKKDAEAFVKEFFSVIEEGLEKDKYVKIKGLGTFKLIEVDSRESINVNTGERFEIQGHTKVTFTPDSNIKEAVNKPFSAFQTVVLADGVDIDAPEENLIDALSDETQDEEPAVVEEPVVEEPVVEEPAAVEEEPTPIEPAEAEPAPESEPAAEEPVVEETVAEEPVAEEPAAEEPVVEETVAEEPEPTAEEPEPAAEEQSVEILPIFDDEAIKTKDQPVSHQQEVIALKLSDEKRKEISKKADGSSTPYLMFLAVLAIMICLGIVAYIYYPDLVGEDNEAPTTPNSSQINTLKSDAENTVVAPVDSVKATAAPDSAATAAETPQPAAAAEKKEVTMPITVREEFVPKPGASQTQTTQPAASQATQNTTASQTQAAKPAATQTQTAKPAAAQRTTADGKYIIDGEITTHVFQKGETLFSLSRQYYKANGPYIYIIEYNKDVIKDPDNVPAGTKLRIPKLIKKK